MTDTKKPLGITDVILRDAHQSILATRMRLDDMLPIAGKLDQVGFWSVESWGGATFDACIRYLGEDPWATLTASLIMALLFVPVLGGLIGKPQYVSSQNQARMVALHNGDFSQATGLTKAYYHTLSIAIKHPFKILFSAILLAVAVGFTYSKAGLGAHLLI